MSEFKDLEMIRANKLVNNPDMPLEGKYRTIWDTRTVGLTWESLEKAMNIMDKRGWRPVFFGVTEQSGQHLVYMVFEKKE